MCSTKELFINHHELKWKKAQGYPPGAMIKDLRNEARGQTFLSKLEKGFEMEGYANITTEQHLVPEGQYEEEGMVYPAGSYRLIPKNTTHGTIKEEHARKRFDREKYCVDCDGQLIE